MTSYYTGVGSRETPPEILTLMTRVASFLSKTHRLRSGAAPGADTAFERGASSNADIYLPWPGFNGHKSTRYTVSIEALQVAAKFHPSWNQCSQGAQKLHGRNMYQVLGENLDTPSAFLLCWTRNGLGSGGTGQAIRLARAYEVPVFDMGKPVADVRRRLFEFLEKQK